MTATATDRRIDELAKNVDHRFDRVEGDVREIRSEIHALRGEVKAGDDALRLEIADLRGEMKAGDDALRAEIKVGHDALRAEMKAGDESLREEIRAVAESVEGLRNLMIRLFAGTLGSIFAGVIVAVLAAIL